ncbi:unnamed protein product, partial [Iphiclides podalirius]
MLRWMCGVTRVWEFMTSPTSDKQESRLRWFGYIKRKPPEYPKPGGQMWSDKVYVPATLPKKEGRYQEGRPNHQMGIIIAY